MQGLPKQTSLTELVIKFNSENTCANHVCWRTGAQAWEQVPVRSRENMQQSFLSHRAGHLRPPSSERRARRALQSTQPHITSEPMAPLADRYGFGTAPVRVWPGSISLVQRSSENFSVNIAKFGISVCAREREKYGLIFGISHGPNRRPHPIR